MNTHIDLLQAAVLALVQGLTEFLPISSSAHLALIPLLSPWPDQGLAFDCVVHLGSLTAVLLYFRHDVRLMSNGFLRTLSERQWENNPDGRMAWFVLLATIPVGVVGLAFKDFIEHDLRSVLVIGCASMGFGLLLWWADRYSEHRRNDRDWSLRHALYVGLAQALALIPGTSRSGATMTMALMLGYSREAAARFSFLLSIPVIVLAGGLKIKDWIESPDQAAGLGPLLLGYVLSAVSAWLCIHFFLKFIERMGMAPFVLYRMILGAVLIWLAF
ncbi:MAG: undecaprenyl-diphosphate phosphatase [Zetaproteobacteria bacterium]|nr:MAG: undecaprenyl-diphosphate phosphatase [Zetaproteobacteria bacterium]